eukprot:Sdes_comp18434_c0_seq3m8355
MASSLFHPQVDPKTGLLNLTKLFPTWIKNENFLWQILNSIASLMENFDSKSPFNSEAAYLFENDLNAFKKRAHQCVQKSIQEINTCEADSSLSFAPWNPRLHEHIKPMILSGNIADIFESSKNSASSHIPCRGFSWIHSPLPPTSQPHPQ